MNKIRCTNRIGTQTLKPSPSGGRGTAARRRWMRMIIIKRKFPSCLARKFTYYRVFLFTVH